MHIMLYLTNQVLTRRIGLITGGEEKRSTYHTDASGAGYQQIPGRAAHAAVRRQGRCAASSKGVQINRPDCAIRQTARRRTPAAFPPPNRDRGLSS